MTSLDQAFAAENGDALLRAVLHDCPDAIVVTDLQGAITGLNEAGERLFGWRASDVIGSPLDMLYAESTVDAAPSVHGRGTGLEALPNGDRSLPRGDRRYRQAGGEVFIGETVGTPIVDARGTELGAVTIVRDVTDHRRTMLALSDLYTVTSSRDLRYQDKVERILEIGCGTFDLPIGVVARVERSMLTVCHSIGGGESFQPGRQVESLRSFCGSTLATNRPLAVEDAHLSPLYSEGFYGGEIVRAYLGSPLNVDGERFGTISFMSPEPRLRAFSGQDLELARLFGEWIGNEIARERDLQALRTAHDRLRTLASTDDLTGVGNRRHFMQLARHDWERMRRTGHALSLLVFDLDHFKAVNDANGHAIGDDLLTAVAGACRRSLRAADVFGRIGGEEFAVLLPEAGAERASEVAERLRATIEAVVVPCPGGAARVTASIGMATAGESDADLAELMTRADTALYRAKELGRNRVEASAPLVTPRA